MRKQRHATVSRGRRRGSKLQPHWALALYLLAAALTSWAALMGGAPAAGRFMSFAELTWGIVEFYAFVLLAVVNYRHDFIPLGKMVLMAAMLLCAALSLQADYQFVATLKSPYYKAILLDAAAGSHVYAKGSAQPLAAATAAFVTLMLLLSRKKPGISQAQSPSVLAVSQTRPEPFERPAASPPISTPRPRPAAAPLRGAPAKPGENAAEGELRQNPPQKPPYVRN
jgi:hypothetical protein